MFARMEPSWPVTAGTFSVHVSPAALGLGEISFGGAGRNLVPVSSFFQEVVLEAPSG